MKVIQGIFSIIVVLYNTRLEDSITFKSLSSSLDSLDDVKFNLIVYDNSKMAQDISSEKYKYWNIIYIHDQTNPGVSKAYNVGSEVADNLGSGWILLTDQDTDFPKESISKYSQAISNNEESGIKLFVPILKSRGLVFSPSKYYFSRGSLWPNVLPGIHSFKNRTVLNSGILVDLEAFKKIEGFNEKIKLYFSDFDFVNRFKKHFSNFYVIDLICDHELSDIVSVDIAAAKRRFGYYCEGSYQSASSKINFTQLFITVFLRSIKLGIKYKDSSFTKIFFKRYLLSK